MGAVKSDFPDFDMTDSDSTRDSEYRFRQMVDSDSIHLTAFLFPDKAIPILDSASDFIGSDRNFLYKALGLHTIPTPLCTLTPTKHSDSGQSDSIPNVTPDSIACIPSIRIWLMTGFIFQSTPSALKRLDSVKAIRLRTASSNSRQRLTRQSDSVCTAIPVLPTALDSHSDSIPVAKPL